MSERGLALALSAMLSGAIIGMIIILSAEFEPALAVGRLLLTLAIIELILLMMSARFLDR